MRKVVIESPFAGPTEEIRAANIEYAKACCLDCLRRGETPYASHLIFPQFLDDDAPEQRRVGILAGLEWACTADATVVYTDLGMSKGMQLGIKHAEESGRPVEYRSLRRGLEG